MKRPALIPCLPALCAAAVLLCAGCQSAPQPRATGPVLPSCDELRSGPAAGLDADEVAAVLDASLQDDTVETCWRPVAQMCLDNDIALPHRHIREALTRFNQQRYRHWFDLAVARYYNEVILDPGVGNGVPQREFITAYVRNGLKTCTSRTCPALQTSRRVCNRLYPDLYEKFFK